VGKAAGIVISGTWWFSGDLLAFSSTFAGVSFTLGFCVLCRLQSLATALTTQRACAMTGCVGSAAMAGAEARPSQSSLLFADSSKGEPNNINAFMEPFWSGLVRRAVDGGGQQTDILCS
jgi:hypothetical protein